MGSITPDGFGLRRHPPSAFWSLAKLATIQIYRKNIYLYGILHLFNHTRDAYLELIHIFPMKCKFSPIAFSALVVSCPILIYFPVTLLYWLATENYQAIRTMTIKHSRSSRSSTSLQECKSPQ